MRKNAARLLPAHRRIRIIQPSLGLHNNRNNNSKRSVQQLPVTVGPTARSRSVVKSRNTSSIEQNRNSASPSFPILTTRSPEPSYEHDLRKLHVLIYRNNSIRNGLLGVQKQIIELSTNAILNNYNCLEGIFQGKIGGIRKLHKKIHRKLPSLKNH